MTQLPHLSPVLHDPSCPIGGLVTTSRSLSSIRSGSVASPSELPVDGGEQRRPFSVGIRVAFYDHVTITRLALANGAKTLSDGRGN
jgi:hypothetical protein